ncbi:MAG: hypothetical protein IPN68_15930 [Bacteroidetes bacterium]|nr:hypothetical protein [Bacteroidota bacterium]
MDNNSETTVDDPVNLDDLQNDPYIKMMYRTIFIKYPDINGCRTGNPSVQYDVKDEPPTRSA